MRMQEAMGANLYRDRAKERRSQFGDGDVPGEHRAPHEEYGWVIFTNWVSVRIFFLLSKWLFLRLTPRGNKVAKVYNTHFVSSFFMIDFYRDELRCSNPPNPSLFWKAVHDELGLGALQWVLVGVINGSNWPIVL